MTITFTSNGNNAAYGAYQEVSFDPATGSYTLLGTSVAGETYIGDSKLDTSPSDGSTSSESPPATETNNELLFWENIYDSALNGVANYSGYMIDQFPIIATTDAQDKRVYYVLFDPAVTSFTSTTVTSDVYTYCFVAGTRIATPAGEQRVQALRIGDRVTKADGTCAAVKWIGRQTVNPLFAKINGKLPVRIRAGALGDGIPARDLFVTPDHAMLVDGVLVHAGALINGRSITQMRSWPHDIEYYHVETEAHEVILAEGAPAETFIDNVSRERFDNHAEYAALYPDAAPMTELDTPRVKFARQLPQVIRSRLDAIADALQGACAKAA